MTLRWFSCCHYPLAFIWKNRKNLKKQKVGKRWKFRRRLSTLIKHKSRVPLKFLVVLSIHQTNITNMRTLSRTLKIQFNPLAMGECLSLSLKIEIQKNTKVCLCANVKTDLKTRENFPPSQLSHSSLVSTQFFKIRTNVLLNLNGIRRS